MLLTGCGAKRPHDIRLGEQWAYRYERLVEANPISSAEKTVREGFFYMLGGDLKDAKPLTGNPGKAREVRLAFFPGKQPPTGMVQYPSAVAVDEFSKAKPLWGIPPQDYELLFFPLPKNYKKGFALELPSIKLPRMMHYPILSLKPTPRRPTPQETTLIPQMNQGQVFSYKGAGKLEKEVGSFGPIRARGGVVSVDGTVVVQAKNRRILYRKEYHLIKMDVVGNVGGQAINIYRQEIRKLEAMP